MVPPILIYVIIATEHIGMVVAVWLVMGAVQVSVTQQLLRSLWFVPMGLSLLVRPLVTLVLIIYIGPVLGVHLVVVLAVPDRVDLQLVP